ncbi:MAG: carbon-phosphorus lyase complex subunit PhnI [Pseudomonadota bacterium]
MYVATKGGEKAIAAAHRQMAEERRGDPKIPALTIAQIREQLSLCVDRCMTEGSLYDRDLAALAIKQSQGDLIEAIFLLRAYRTTLPRFGYSRPIDTGSMAIVRRVSATFKDIPGGQILGPTFDYTHRLLDFKLAAETEGPRTVADRAETPVEQSVPHVLGLLDQEGLIQKEKTENKPAPDLRIGRIDFDHEKTAERPEAFNEDTPPDLTREPLEFPASRALRLQALARGDEGFLLGLAYSTQRGYARNHAFVGELRIGAVAVEFDMPELGITIELGEVTVTECETVTQFQGSKSQPPQFTRGYGLSFGQTERKALSMALVERALRWSELDEDFVGAAAQDEEFVLAHVDNIQATGFLEHIKLPHYVDFQSELELVRRMRREIAEDSAGRDLSETAE